MILSDALSWHPWGSKFWIFFSREGYPKTLLKAFMGLKCAFRTQTTSNFHVTCSRKSFWEGCFVIFFWTGLIFKTTFIVGVLCLLQIFHDFLKPPKNEIRTDYLQSRFVKHQKQQCDGDDGLQLKQNHCTVISVHNLDFIAMYKLTLSRNNCFIHGF